MAGLTQAQAQAQLDAWIAASIAVAGNQEYEMPAGNGGQRRLKRADAAAILNMIKYWENRVQELSAVATGGGGITYLVP